MCGRSKGSSSSLSRQAPNQGGAALFPQGVAACRVSAGWRVKSLGRRKVGLSYEQRTELLHTQGSTCAGAVKCTRTRLKEHARKRVEWSVGRSGENRSAKHMWSSWLGRLQAGQLLSCTPDCDPVWSGTGTRCLSVIIPCHVQAPCAVTHPHHMKQAAPLDTLILHPAGTFSDSEAQTFPVRRRARRCDSVGENHKHQHNENVMTG